MIHLEGMGIMGCYLAVRLADDGIPFTWNDTDAHICAWRASTGAIFPTGHDEDMQALEVWRGHLAHPSFAGHVEEASFVFGSKHPPHGGRYGFEDLGPVRIAAEHSVHLNAQTWVPYIRALFGAARLVYPPDDTAVTRIVTHGYGLRLDRFMWGWTVPVRLRTRQEWDLRQALYFRRGRFTMAYAYPIAGTDMWYAGSSLISQNVPKTLVVESKFQRWRETFLELADGYVLGVARAGLPVEGWRPVPAKGDDAWVNRGANGLYCKPLWHSGIRHAPLVYNALKEAL